MDLSTIKFIIKKLEEIDNKISQLEKGNNNFINNQQSTSEEKKRDPLFSKALEVIDQYEEISAEQLAKALKIDLKRAEVIMDQLESAGLGTCYTKDV